MYKKSGMDGFHVMTILTSGRSSTHLLILQLNKGWRATSFYRCITYAVWIGATFILWRKTV